MEAPMMTGPTNELRFAARHETREVSAESKHHGMEHRWGLRILCGAVVRISAGEGVTVCGRMRDVSTSGAFVETPLALPLFSPVEISLPSDGGDSGSEVLAWVVRRDAAGVGIEWVETASGSICALLCCTEHFASSPGR